MTLARRLSAVLWALAVLATASVAHAAGPRAAVEAMEASMLVSGTIEVDRAGKVGGFEIAGRDRLPRPVDRLLADRVPQWRFEPMIVDGQPAPVRTSMRIRVAANKVPGQPDSYVLRIASASFGGLAEDGLRPAKGNAAPRYPGDALRNRVEGTVYVLVKVGRAGTVEDVIAEQVNVQLIASERDLQRMRAAFGRAAVHAARGWGFTLPTGPDADAPYWIARVPVAFRLHRAEPAYGQWTTYVPGPRHVPPWAVDDSATGADGLAANEIHVVGTGLKLLTPLGGNG